jgi:FHA domain
VDIFQAPRENHFVALPGTKRNELARSLAAAYARGLISENTFAGRLDEVLASRVIDPMDVVGDLSPSGPGPRLFEHFAQMMRIAVRRLPFLTQIEELQSVLLGSDWKAPGESRELFIGRSSSCDIVLSDASVSRRHARLVLRDGSWVVQDLESTNGTNLNGRRIHRCELRPGDQLILGRVQLRVD